MPLQSYREVTVGESILESTPFVIGDNSGGRPLNIVAKRYRFSDYLPGQPGVILILAHAAGFNKEIWEPFLEELGHLQHVQSRRLRVKEAWAFDSPNHGESIRLNERVLFADPKVITLEEYARAGLRLLRSGLIENLDHERIIVVGHSVGAVAGVWFTSLYHQEDRKLLDSCIMIEPPAEVLTERAITEQKTQHFIEATRVRRDIWSSKKEAFEWLAVRRPWNTWDRRALKAYVDYGLRPLPTSWYPDRSGVTLSCHRLDECFAYDNVAELNIFAKRIASLRQVLPIHVVVGERSFIRPTDDACKVIATTPGMSLTRVSKGGHLLLQEMPRDLARFVLTALEATRPREEMWRTSRL